MNKARSIADALLELQIPDEVQLSPDGKQTGIYQLSIHADQQIYPQLLSLNSENLLKISAFAWSPCGQYVAYTCQDKEDSEDENKMPTVYGQHWKYGCLYLLKVYGGTPTAIYNQPRHVHEFVWTPDAKSLVFDTHKYPERSSPYFDGSVVYAVSIESLEVSIVCDFPGHLENLTWHQDHSTL